MAELVPMHLTLNRLVRFGLVGSLNTAAAYVTFAVLLRAGVHFATATLIGSLVSMLMGFWLHGAIVFRHSGEGRFLRFLAIFLAMYGPSIAIQWLARHWMNGFLAGGVAALVTIPFSFVLNGSLVFRPDHRGEVPLKPGECLICGGRDLAPALSRCRDLYLGMPAVVDYGRCRGCGLTQQVPTPVATDGFYLDYPIHVPKSRAFSLGRKLLIRRVYYDPGRGDAEKTLLDFGCGDGSYLESVAGKVAVRLGFEPTTSQAEAVAARLGIPVASALADDATVPDGSVDIITSHFVLEHLTDLRGTFAYWHRKLKSGGTLHLAVPNIDCLEARLFGKHWHGLDAPRHISFPSKENMETLASMSGFSVVRHGNGLFPNTWAASLVAAALGRHQQALFLLLMPIAFLLALIMPQSTAVYVLKRDY